LLLEPHGAVGWRGLEVYLAENQTAGPCVSLETAHPAKFPDEIIELLGIRPDLPPGMRGIESRKGEPEHLACDYGLFRTYLKDTLKTKD